jgi:hypothetical protein
MIKLISPVNGQEISLQTEIQKQFFADELHRAQMDGALTFQWYDLKRQGEDHSAPAPVVFSWQESECGNEHAAYYLLVSEHADMRDAWYYVTEQTEHAVYNLKVNTVYYWCVQRNGKRSEIASFKTADTLPRCIKIDHISNVRDMGGYRVKGGRIRQGLLYRGGELELHMQLCDEGARELLRLGVRTELDMRGEARWQVDFTTAEAIGIARIYVPSVPYENVFDPTHAEQLHRFFEVLTERASYPVYFHCWGGADRGGTFAFVIGAALGMRYEDLIDEYEFTGLSIWGVRSRNYQGFQAFLKGFMDLPGMTLQEKARAFLMQYAGLTREQIAAIEEILVEKDGED